MSTLEEVIAAYYDAIRREPWKSAFYIDATTASGVSPGEIKTDPRFTARYTIKDVCVRGINVSRDDLACLFMIETEVVVEQNNEIKLIEKCHEVVRATLECYRPFQNKSNGYKSVMYSFSVRVNDPCLVVDFESLKRNELFKKEYLDISSVLMDPVTPGPLVVYPVYRFVDIVKTPWGLSLSFEWRRDFIV